MTFDPMHDRDDNRWASMRKEADANKITMQSSDLDTHCLSQTSNVQLKNAEKTLTNPGSETFKQKMSQKAKGLSKFQKERLLSKAGRHLQSAQMAASLAEKGDAEDSLDDDSLQDAMNRTEAAKRVSGKSLHEKKRKATTKGKSSGNKKTIRGRKANTKTNLIRGRLRKKQALRVAGASRQTTQMASSIATKASHGVAHFVQVIASVVTQLFSSVIALLLPAIVIIVFISMIFGMFSSSSQRAGGWGTDGLGPNEIAIMTYLKDKGLDQVHVAAIMGNWKSEGHWRDGDLITNQGEIGVDPSSEAYGKGLASFTGAARHVLDAEANARHIEWTNITVQLDVWYFMYSGDRSQLTINPGDYGLSGPNFMWRPSSGPTMAFAAKYKLEPLSYTHRFEIFNNQWLPITDVEEATLFYYFLFGRGADWAATDEALARYVGNAKAYYDTFMAGSSEGSVITGGKLNHPLPGSIITSYFGPRSLDNHKGMDFAMPGDSTGAPYYAAEAGTVLYATNGGGYNGGAGNWIVIDHGGGLVTKYMHSSVTLVTPGQTVTRGQHIGNVGNTGQSFGAHLHFQVEVNGVAVDPATYLDL